MRTKIVNILVALLLLLAACTPHPKDVSKVDVMPPIYPDYTDITVPCNIAPLNFLLRGNIDAVEVIAKCGDNEIRVNEKGNEICFGMSEWKDFLDKAKDKTINVQVSARTN